MKGFLISKDLANSNKVKIQKEGCRDIITSQGILERKLLCRLFNKASFLEESLHSIKQSAHFLWLLVTMETHKQGYIHPN